MEEMLGKKRRKTCGFDNLAKDTPDIPGTQENGAAKDEEADPRSSEGAVEEIPSDSNTDVSRSVQAKRLPWFPDWESGKGGGCPWVNCRDL